jgi:hypothetical protein
VSAVRPPSSRRALAAALAGVVAGVAVFVGVGLALGRVGDDPGDVEIRLGDDVFRAGRVDALATAVARQGPVLFPDASPRQRRDI